MPDDLPPWFNNHEIYHAPSPKFDQLREPICKHNGILPYDTITLSTGLYGYRSVNDGFIEAQPSGIEGIYEEDSTMYFEYESGILRFPGARGLFTAALRVNASNAESPQCGKTAQISSDAQWHFGEQTSSKKIGSENRTSSDAQTHSDARTNSIEEILPIEETLSKYLQRTAEFV